MGLGAKRGQDHLPKLLLQRRRKSAVSTIFMLIYQMNDVVREKLNVNPENVHKIWKQCREGVSAPAAGARVCVREVNVTRSDGKEVQRGDGDV